MVKRKLNAKQFALQKKKRRQWLTFVRMCRYGVNNFSRNAWLTVAATAVMTITLLIVFTTVTARSTLASTVDVIRDNVDMSIYLRNDVSLEAVNAITADVKKLKSVKEVEYESPAEARKKFAEQNSNDAKTLNALNQATNKNPGTLHIKLIDINDTEELRKFTETNQTVKDNIDSNREPSFAGDRKSAIKTIGSWVSVADRAGLVGTIVFISISSLIVFNTIRMAIFNRRDEIEMMKLIGADRSFIRGPFVVEAVVYGFIAAVIATGLGMFALFSLKDKLLSYKVSIQPTIDFLTMYIGFVLLGMIILGAIIGVISSLLATRRYLKI